MSLFAAERAHVHVAITTALYTEASLVSRVKHSRDYPSTFFLSIASFPMAFTLFPQSIVFVPKSIAVFPISLNYVISPCSFVGGSIGPVLHTMSMSLVLGIPISTIEFRRVES